jgi:hypothetical protein
MASLSNQSTYSSLEPHASSQKEASICSILLRVGEISHATQTPPGRKKKNQIKPKALVLLQKPGEEEGTSEKAAAATNGDDAELAQGLRRHQGHHHRQPRQPQLRLQGPPSIPKSPLPKLFLFVCVPQSLVKFIRTLASWCGGTGLCCSWALGSVGSDCCPLALCRIWMSRS